MGLEKIEMIAEGLDHPEGIAIAADGSLIVGGEAGQIYVVEPDGAFREIANTGGFALGIAADSDGHVYVCNDALNSVLRVTCSTGDVEQFASATEGRQMRVPNWPAFDSRGNLYVSDSGAWGARDGLIWVVRPGRRLEVFSDQAADFTNGLAVSADESVLYAAESNPGKLVEIPINDDGTAGPRRILCDLGLAVPDGIAMADDGSIVIACYRPDAIFRWSAGDGLEILAADPQGTVLTRRRTSPSRGTIVTWQSCPTWAAGISLGSVGGARDPPATTFLRADRGLMVAAGEAPGLAGLDSGSRTHDARESRFGRLYEDLVPGDRFRHWPGKTITEGDHHVFCLLTMSASPLHTDAEYARATCRAGSTSFWAATSTRSCSA